LNAQPIPQGTDNKHLLKAAEEDDKKAAHEQQERTNRELAAVYAVGTSLSRLLDGAVPTPGYHNRVAFPELLAQSSTKGADNEHLLSATEEEPAGEEELAAQAVQKQAAQDQITMA
jgi:hypothetical protein